MKKLIAAALTGALVLGTVGTSVVFAADDDKTITVAASETPHSEILEAAKPILEVFPRRKTSCIRQLLIEGTAHLLSGTYSTFPIL